MATWLNRRGTGSGPTPLATPGVEQTAVAKTGATVLQAGRDVITGNVFVGRFARLRDVWLDPASVFEEVDVDRFVGRDWLVNSVDSFIEKHDRGYVVVHAAAGLGKTAFAAWLVSSRDLPCHFTRRRKGRVSSTALRNLAAQLIARYDLAERFAPNGMLPETAGEPGWFDQVLRAASEAAARAGARVVLVVDGLDEAEHVDGDLPLGLPAALPAGVYVVATCRTGTPLAALRQPWRSLGIEADDRRNAADLRQYLTVMAGEQPLANMLAGTGMPAKAFAQQLAGRCGGVWVYLRYVLDELRFGMRGLDGLDQLPADLASYYLESLTSPNGDPALTPYRMSLLATLAAVAEPLPLGALASLAGLPSAAPVRSLCHGMLRPFLTVHADEPDNPRYGIYHVSLREFLNGATPPYAMDVTRYRAEEFAHATKNAHARIAEHYLDLFGGINTQLANLAADPTLAGAEGGYPRRYLAYHLEQAGQVPTLHRLLSCESRIGPDRATNVWFAVHDSAGSIDDYLTDIQRARRHAEAHTDAQLNNAEPTTGLGLEIRYAATTAAIATLTANVPIPLVHRLVTAGLWDIDRALRHANHLHDPANKAQALSALVPEVPPADQAKVIGETLTAARGLIDDGARARILTDLSRHLAGRQQRRVLADALTAAGGILDSGQRAQALRNMTPLLTGKLAAMALEEVRRLALESQRVGVLYALAPRLPTEAVEQAHADGVGIESPAERAVALGMLALRLGQTRRDHELMQAWTLASAVSDPAGRAWALWWLATEPLPEPVREQALDDALTAARGLPDHTARAWALGRIAPYLATDARAEVTAESLALVMQDDDLEIRSEILGQLADELHDNHRENLISDVLQAARDLPTDWAKVSVISNIAPNLSERLMAETLDSITKRVTDEHARNWIIGELAPLLPAQLVGEALTATRTMSDEYGTAQVLCQIALHLSEPARGQLLAEALAAGRATTDPHLRGWVLAELSPHLPDAHRDKTLVDALVAARSSEGQSQVFTLLDVARRLQQPLRTEVLTEALKISRETVDPEQRSWHLYRVATLVLPPLRQEVATEALTAIRSLPLGLNRIRLLASVTHHFPSPQREQLLAEVLDLAQELSKDNARSAPRLLGRFVRNILRRVPLQVLTDSLAVGASLASTVTLDETAIRIEPLRELVAVALRYLPRRLLTDMITAAHRIPSNIEISAPLGAVALLLPEPQRSQALNEALATVRYTITARRTILTVASQLPDQTTNERVKTLRCCLDNLGLDDFLSVLATAIPILHTTGGQTTVESCLETIHTIQRWWHNDTVQPAPP
jgi:hypothetical protein